METSNIFRLNLRDVGRALVMAVIGGFITPFLIAIQTPGFDIMTTDWASLLNVAMNGALIAALTYLSKNFITDKEGKIGGIV